MRRPEPELLFIWRCILVTAVFPPAFLISFLMKAGSFWWTVLTTAWIVCFLFFYLFYLPVQYRKRRYRITRSQIDLHSGVFYNRIRTMPLDSVQFAGIHISPFHAMRGLATLVVTAAGGRVRLSGLKRSDAEAMLRIITGDGGSQHY